MKMKKIIDGKKKGKGREEEKNTRGNVHVLSHFYTLCCLGTRGGFFRVRFSVAVIILSMAFSR